MKREQCSPELLKKIKDSIHLADVVSEQVLLKKVGAHFVGLCPFHSERSPSFNVHDKKQLFFCHGCKKGGDLFTYVMEAFGMSFHEAIDELSERAGIARAVWQKGNFSHPKPSENQQKVALSYKLNRFVAHFYHHHVEKNMAPQAYLDSRGVSKSLREVFYVGFAPESWDSLTLHLTATKAPLELVKELGLVRGLSKGFSRSKRAPLF